jgi:uncharacterized RDD family membrane protein YckC
MKWYYVLGGEQKGPVSEGELQSLVALGTLTSMTLVWREGMANWQSLAEVRKPAEPPVAAAAGLQLSAAAPPAGGRLCSQCGRTFPADHVLQFGLATVCAECKPAYLQRVREGGLVGGPAGQLQYANWGIRFAAKFIDGLIGAAAGIVVQIGLAALMQPRQEGVFFPLAYIGASFGSGLAIQVGFQTFFLGRFGATPGKMVCKLKVVTPEGSPVTYMTAFGRSFAEILSQMICYIGYLMPLWDTEHRALHDRICNTRVVVRPD